VTPARRAEAAARGNAADLIDEPMDILTAR